MTRLVAEGVGLKLVTSSRRALFSVIWSRLRLRLRGLDFEERRLETIDPGTLRRLDVC